MQGFQVNPDFYFGSGPHPHHHHHSQHQHHDYKQHNHKEHYLQQNKATTNNITTSNTTNCAQVPLHFDSVARLRAFSDQLLWRVGANLLPGYRREMHRRAPSGVLRALKVKAPVVAAG